MPASAVPSADPPADRGPVAPPPPRAPTRRAGTAGGAAPPSPRYPSAQRADGRLRAAMSQPSFPTIAVVGPTATGKTALALGLARRLGRAELLNADSRQVLRELRVGTNQPTAGGLRGVPCHLLGITEPGEPFSVADWVAAARRCLADLDRAITPIVVGGTGLYVKALMDGFELSGGAPAPERRGRLRERAASPEGLAE